MTKIEKEKRFLLDLRKKLNLCEEQIANYELLLEQKEHLVKSIKTQEEYIQELEGKE